MAKLNISGVAELILNNTVSSTSLIGDRLNDSIVNSGFNVTISTNAGQDTVRSYSRQVTIDGGIDDDFVDNVNGNSVSIFGGEGNDTINNQRGFANTIVGGKGNDSINVSLSEKALIAYRLGDGSDVIEGFNGESQLSLSGGVYTSTIDNNDFILTLGDDKITLKGVASLPALNIFGVEEFHVDTVNAADNALILGTVFEDTIVNSGSKVTIDAFDSEDSISSTGNDVIIFAGTGKDSVINQGSKVLINGGVGNDYLRNSGSNVSIDGDLGNDTIDNQNGDNLLITYSAGGGNDLIQGFKANSTLKVMVGRFSTQKSGDDVIVTVEEEKVTLKGAAKLSKVNIEAQEGKAVNITNVEDDILIMGSDLNDTIDNHGSKVKIIAFDGNDSITSNAPNVTIESGGGNDSITNSDSKVTIDGGAGDDTIDNQSPDVTIFGGEGNDSINSKSDHVTINGGDGNDNITSNGEGVTINGGNGNDSITSNGNYVVIQNSEGNDYITSNGDYATIAIGMSNTVNSTGSDVVFKCDGHSRNKRIDEDVIYGFNRNSTLVFAGEEFTEKNVSGNDLVFRRPSNLGTITLKDCASLQSGINIEVEDNQQQSSGQQRQKGVNQTITHSSSLYNPPSKGTEYDDTITSTATNLPIELLGGNDVMYSNGGHASINGGSGDDVIWLLAGDNSTVEGGEGEDIIYNRANNTHFRHMKGDGNDVIYGFKSNSTLSVLIPSRDGYSMAQPISYSLRNNGNDVIVLTNNGEKITLKDAARLSKINIEGNRNGGQETVNRNDNVQISTGNGGATVENYGANVTISAGSYSSNVYVSNKALNTSIKLGRGNDTIVNIGANTTMSTGIDEDYILNYGKYCTISGGYSDDTIDNDMSANNVLIEDDYGEDVYRNRAAFVTIIGGRGNDTIYNDGDNVVFDYTHGAPYGKDVIYGFKENSTLLYASEYSMERKDSDIILSLGFDKITLKGAADIAAPHITGQRRKTAQDIDNVRDDVTVMGTAYGDIITNKGARVTISAISGHDSIDNDGYGNDASINAGIGNDTINNLHSASDVTLEGGDGNDKIFNNGNNASIKGGDGNDTITNDFAMFVTIEGGKGDDYITNDGDNNTFVYSNGDGNDVIYGFNDMSTLEISGGSYTTQRSGNDVIVTVGRGKITLKGAANIDLNIDETSSRVAGAFIDYRDSLWGNVSTSDDIFDGGDCVQDVTLEEISDGENFIDYLRIDEAFGNAQKLSDVVAYLTDNQTRYRD